LGLHGPVHQIAATAGGAAIAVGRAPHPVVLWAIALGGLTAAAASIGLALTSHHVSEPGLQAVLIDWVILPYVLGGLVAWWRRPDSRFGPLMVAAGFVTFFFSFAWANVAVPHVRHFEGSKQR
jgi:hypothetical protein